MGEQARETGHSPARQAAAQVVDRLQKAGRQAYWVGGCVRDLLLGREPSDFDVVTNARPTEIMNLFEKTFPVGVQFGIVLVASYGKGGDDAEKVLTEVATYRSDSAYTDGRHPDAVRFADSAREDVLRRDFTINGLLLDPRLLSQNAGLRDAVVDYVGGLEDLDRRVVRAIGEPRLRFAEDKLRMLRAVRIAARFGFALEPGTAAAIQRSAPEIHQVSAERVRDELTRMLTEGHARQAFELLDTTGLLQEVLPEVARMQGVEQPPEFHPEGDVWIHTLGLLEQLPEGAPSTLAWGALLHDIGKPATFQRAPDRIRFHGHVEVGVRIAEAICRRLRFSAAETAQIVSLVENHMRFGDVKKMKESTLKRFFRLPRFPEHLALHKMDSLAGHGSLDLYNFARERYESTPTEHVMPKLLVTGRDLIAAGYQPGPGFKQMLQLAEDAQLEGRIMTREEGLALIRESFPNG